MSEKKKEPITEQKVSRRSMLKWTGALAAAAAVGAVAEYGASELMKPVTPPPPPPASFKPPLSPEIAQRVDAIKQQLIDRHAGEKTYYVGCHVNGCWNPCLLRAHVKNGVITAFETDHTINNGVLREDAVIGEDAVKKAMVQVRGCSRGYGRRKNIYTPTRLTYPMKRAGQRGERKWVRISWTEALDTIAGKFKELKDKYGPNFTTGAPVGAWYGYGYGTWASSSFSGVEFHEINMLGGNPPSPFFVTQTHEGTDLFNSKLIVMWGWNPLLNYPESAYWITLAKAKGIPIIAVDPTLSASANALADQWIPIRPGTDTAALLAIANVLFKEDLYDKDYVSKFVEPTGFEKWKGYVLGDTAGEDGAVDRTPEWQEKITGVPAETVRELARLYAKSKPCHFHVHFVVSRGVQGEMAAGLSLALQAMTGNLGVAGGWVGGAGFGMPSYVPVPAIDWKRAPTTYKAASYIYTRGWMDAVLLREKLESKQIGEEEYRQRIGTAQSMPLVNPQMLWITSNYLSGIHDLNKVIAAMAKMDFIVAAPMFVDHPSSFMADMILPCANWHWEGEATNQLGTLPTFKYGAEWAVCGIGNYFYLSPKIIEPPGEAKSIPWMQVQVAKRLGVDKQVFPRLADVPDEKWDQNIMGLYQEAYEAWRTRPDIAPRNPPTWDKFLEEPVYRIPLDREPFHEFGNQIQRGAKFPTASGKIEYYSEAVASGDVAIKGLPYAPTRCYGGARPSKVPSVPQWVQPWNSMIGPRTNQFPLMMISSHSFYRLHSVNDNNLWLRDEYRHACWLNVADAKARDVKDGDMVRVFNDKGELVLPAHVTSRMTPGVCCVRFGTFYEPSQTKTSLMPFGIDRRGAANFLTPSDAYPWIDGPVVCSNLVEVQKF